MTIAAWIFMLCTWAVIIYFCGKFFLKVLRTPPRQEEGE